MHGLNGQRRFSPPLEIMPPNGTFEDSIVFPVQESFEASVQEKLICDKDQ
jgi:hypothetical protein